MNRVVHCRECGCTFKAAQPKRRRRGEREIGSLLAKTCSARCRWLHSARLSRRWNREHRDPVPDGALSRDGPRLAEAGWRSASVGPCRPPPPPAGSRPATRLRSQVPAIAPPARTARRRRAPRRGGRAGVCAFGYLSGQVEPRPDPAEEAARGVPRREGLDPGPSGPFRGLHAPEDGTRGRAAWGQPDSPRSGVMGSRDGAETRAERLRAKRGSPRPAALRPSKPERIRCSPLPAR